MALLDNGPWVSALIKLKGGHKLLVEASFILRVNKSVQMDRDLSVIRKQYSGRTTHICRHRNLRGVHGII